MRPILTELPPPPPGKTGWPWTEESPQLPDTMPDGSPWPWVSVVTPSYNQVQFLEETIRSVLLQGYPNLEYIIMDGGSTDGSVEVIRKYEPWLAYWVSEPDRGQTEAIKKGFRRARGQILAWLNSDDTYNPDAVSKAVRCLHEHPAVAFIYSNYYVVDEEEQHLYRARTRTFDISQQVLQNLIPQPTTFIRRDAVEAVGGLDESLHYAMDYDLWIRLGLHFPVSHLPRAILASFRMHTRSKTVAQEEGFAPEVCQILLRTLDNPDLDTLPKWMQDRIRLNASFHLAILGWRLDRPEEEIRRHLERAQALDPGLRRSIGRLSARFSLELSATMVNAEDPAAWKRKMETFARFVDPEQESRLWQAIRVTFHLRRAGEYYQAGRLTNVRREMLRAFPLSPRLLWDYDRAAIFLESLMGTDRLKRLGRLLAPAIARLRPR